MKLKVPLQAGTFFTLQGGYAIFFQDQSPGEVSIGVQYNMSSMLSVWELEREGNHVGFYFHSPFAVENKGGVLVAFAESKKGKATESKLMLRHDTVMVYDIAGCGALAISTKVSPEILSIIEEQ